MPRVMASTLSMLGWIFAPPRSREEEDQFPGVLRQVTAPNQGGGEIFCME